MSIITDRYLILDCFVDEPACFGVPPFLAPYPRYIFGALVDGGVTPDRIEYRTIDSVRSSEYSIPDNFSAVFLIGGAVVPGKYLASRIGSIAEIEKIIRSNPGQHFIVGGLVSRAVTTPDNEFEAIQGDIEKRAHSLASGTDGSGARTVEEIARWSVLGAPMVTQHPDYPRIICEIETSRGCPRQSHCSFCSEGLIKRVEFRQNADIINEVDALINSGITRIRLGRQADILQHGTGFTNFRKGFPMPEVNAVRELFSALKTRRERGNLELLNIDNGNPGTIVNFPEESALILEAITDAVTPGDTIALGIESFDPAVIANNNLKVSPDEAVQSIRMINRIGGKRVRGIPVLLPGINLIQGLANESSDTFRINYEWLKIILGEGLLVKRINIRKLLPFPGTPLYNNRPRSGRQVLNRFEYYRSVIRKEIDISMLKMIYPAGTILPRAQVVENQGSYSYARQIASYAITAKVPLGLKQGSFLDLVVTGHRERSISALPFPIDMNSLPQTALEQIPGIGKKKASQIVLGRPFNRLSDIRHLVDSVDAVISDSMIFLR